MRYFIPLIFASFAVAVNAAPSTPCKRLMVEPGKQYELNSTLDQTTHIIFPEQLLSKPITGNRELWTVDSAGSHVFIQPNSSEPKGFTTTLTVITQSDVSYDFIIKRNMNVVDNCVQIVEGKILDNAQRAALEAGSGSGVGGNGGSLREQMTQMQAQHKSEVVNSVAEALRKYRYHIYTRYDWSAGSGFIGKDLISDVYDDGRFTYIRLSNDNKGLLAIEASIADRSEFVEAKYDDVSKMYKVVGIYPKFKLSYDKTTVDVSRHDNVTQGNY